MQPLGLGIIGLHHQHPRWYHALWNNLPQYMPLAVAEADEAFLAEENEFFQLAPYANYSALLDRDDIDVVIIWLPHSQMPAAVAAAAAAGKHVIVEKPGAADVAGLQQIVDTARRHPKIKISSPYCWRTHPVSDMLRSAVQAGLLGPIRTMEGRLQAGGPHRYLRDHAPWMLQAGQGGGPMWNLGVHWIDYFRWLTNRQIVSVSGVKVTPTGPPQRDIEDTAQALLVFEDGATAMIEVGYALPESYPGKRDIYLAFRGTIGDAVWTPAWGGAEDELLIVSEHENAGENRCRRIPVRSQNIPGYGGHMAWQWLSDFAEAVRNNSQPLVSPYDMLAAGRVAEAFYRSCDTGCAETVQTH
ncbi:MAG: Gfo/Idh/MocA family oxidoreductase [Planctomycetes bacterium]|nr:Gfo/Idh/MocA family oxidoreductase [Planctomycetota bacterium]